MSRNQIGNKFPNRVRLPLMIRVWACPGQCACVPGCAWRCSPPSWCSRWFSRRSTPSGSCGEQRNPFRTQPSTSNPPSTPSTTTTLPGTERESLCFRLFDPNSKKARGSIPDPRVLGSVPNVRRLTPIPSSLKLLLTGHRESKTWGRSATWSSDAWKFASGVAWTAGIRRRPLRDV